MFRTTGRLAAVLLVSVLVAAACGDDDAATTTRATTTTQAQGTTTTGAAATTTTAASTGRFGLPLVDPLGMPAGGIDIAGSSTVFPLSGAVMTRWIDEGGPDYGIDSIGSGGGLERFCVAAESDIANASRPINDEEIAACTASGREPIEIRVGTDALSLVISNGNYFAHRLSLDEIARAFSLPEGSTWDQVNPSFPAHPLKRYSPGTDSGTFDYFNEAVFDNAQPSPILSAGVEIVGENDDLTVNGVANDGCTEGDLGSVCAIGYFGYAYYQQNAGSLQVVAVDGVTPSDASVNDGDYPLARPLFMYTAASVIQAKPQVALWIAYYLDVVDDVIGEVGYFPAPEASLQETADALKAAAGF